LLTKQLNRSATRQSQPYALSKINRAKTGTRHRCLPAATLLTGSWLPWRITWVLKGKFA